MPDHDTPSPDDAHRAARRESNRKWRLANAERRREYNKMYWQANAERLKAAAAVRYAAKHAERLEGAASYRDRNRDTIRAKKKAFQEANGEHLAAQRAVVQVRRKAAAILHYGGPTPACSCCGETTPGFLTIDHIGGGGNVHRAELGTADLYWWLRKNGFPEGFRVLCIQCNWADGVYGRCPHVDASAGNFLLIPPRWERGARLPQVGRQRKVSDSGADEAP